MRNATTKVRSVSCALRDSLSGTANHVCKFLATPRRAAPRPAQRHFPRGQEYADAELFKIHATARRVARWRVRPGRAADERRQHSEWSWAGRVSNRGQNITQSHRMFKEPPKSVSLLVLIFNSRSFCWSCIFPVFPLPPATLLHTSTHAAFNLDIFTIINVGGIALGGGTRGTFLGLETAVKAEEEMEEKDQQQFAELHTPRELQSMSSASLGRKSSETGRQRTDKS